MSLRYSRRVASGVIPGRKGSVIVNLPQPVKVRSAEHIVVSTSLQWILLLHTREHYSASTAVMKVWRVLNDAPCVVPTKLRIRLVPALTFLLVFVK